MMNERLCPIVVRGGGDLATGTIFMLSAAGYTVIVLESARPTAIRREAAFSEAVYLGKKTVEGITCVRCESAEEAVLCAAPGKPALLVDETCASLPVIRPRILIDAILAKKNLGTRMDMAELVIALGPGFCADRDVHAVIETMRGHDLGRVIRSGSALPNTGIPGDVCGYTSERVIHAPAAGILHTRRKIGNIVRKGESIAWIRREDGSSVEVPSALDGVLRGILPDTFPVPSGMKMADVDPRVSEQKNCYTISDKSRCIGGSVLMLVTGFVSGHGLQMP